MYTPLYLFLVNVVMEMNYIMSIEGIHDWVLIDNLNQRYVWSTLHLHLSWHLIVISVGIWLTVN